MTQEPQIFGYEDSDATLCTACHVYERDDQVLTVQLHSHGLHKGFLFAEKNIVTVVDGDTELTMRTPDGSHRSQIVHVMYLSENEIISASADGGINLWTFADNNELQWKNYLNGSRNHLSALQVTCPNHDTGIIVATTKDGYLSVWCRETLIPILSAAAGNARCLDPKGLYSVELFETAGLLVMGGSGRIYVHEDVNSRSEDPFTHVTTLGGHRGPVLALASLNLARSETSVRDIIISGGEDKSLVVWDANMLQEYTRQSCAHDSSITSITILATSSVYLSATPLLVSASRDGHIKIWSLPSLTLFHNIGAHQGVVVQVSVTLRYSRFNHRPAILSTGTDKHMKIWKIYRILNWKRRQSFAMFLAYCGFIKRCLVLSIPRLVISKADDSSTAATIAATNTTDMDGAVSTAKQENDTRAVIRVFNVESMCQEIITFL